MTMTPLDEIEYKMWEPPTRTELPEAATGIITFSRVGLHGQTANILLDGRPLEQRLIKHSPTGLEFGYGGSGPADTALNMLALVVSPKEANRLHQRYKQEVVAHISQKNGGSIKVEEILDWVRDVYQAERGDTTRMAREEEMRQDLAEIARLDAAAAAEEPTNA